MPGHAYVTHGARASTSAPSSPFGFICQEAIGGTTSNVVTPTSHPTRVPEHRLGNMTRPTLLQSQTNALLTLLNLNKPSPASSSSSPFPRPATPSTSIEDAQGPLVWKVLILDELSKDILATSLRVQDLREQGVTLHMQLHSPRPPLGDVPAVYFVSPTLANIRRIAEVSA